MHIIRLRKPWKKCPIDLRDGKLDEANAERVDVPEPASPAVTASPAEPQSYRYQRSFNRPTGLSGSSKVYLKVTSWSGKLVSATLNEHDLPIAGDAIDIEITDQMDSSNRLELVLSDRVVRDAAECQQASLCGEVTLEIDEA